MGNKVSKWRTSVNWKGIIQKHKQIWGNLLERNTLQGINISPWCLAYLSRWFSELPQVGYVNFLEGTPNIGGISLDLSFSHLLRRKLLASAWVSHTRLHFLQSSKALQWQLRTCRPQQFPQKNSKTTTIHIKAFWCYNTLQQNMYVYEDIYCIYKHCIVFIY